MTTFPSSVGTSSNRSEVDPLKEADGNKQGRTKQRKMKRNNIQVNPHWTIKNKEITPKDFRCTLECKCSKCGKKLRLQDAFCCFEPNRKIKSGLHRGELYSIFFCADCAKKHEHGLA